MTTSQTNNKAQDQFTLSIKQIVTDNSLEFAVTADNVKTKYFIFYDCDQSVKFFNKYFGTQSTKEDRWDLYCKIINENQSNNFNNDQLNAVLATVLQYQKIKSIKFDLNNNNFVIDFDNSFDEQQYCAGLLSNAIGIDLTKDLI